MIILTMSAICVDSETRSQTTTCNVGYVKDKFQLEAQVRHKNRLRREIQLFTSRKKV